MRSLNKKILDVILTIQTYAQFKRREARTLGKDLSVYDWEKDAEEYYYNLPNEILKGLRLRKNKLDFEKVLYFKVTDEIMSTEVEKLNQFRF